MPTNVCYFIYKEKETGETLQKMYNEGKFERVAVEFLPCETEAEFLRKGEVITKDDAVVYVDFPYTDNELARKLCHEWAVPIRWFGVTSLNELDVQSIFNKPEEPAAEAEAPKETSNE